MDADTLDAMREPWSGRSCVAGPRQVIFCKPSEEDRASALCTRRENAACLARDLAPILEDIRANGIAAELTRREIPTPRGSKAWSAFQCTG